jgi:DNA-3-methyladenine glycosylase II
MLSDIVNQEDINRLISIDKLFAFIHKKYGPPPNWTRPQGFISLSKIILEQQVSLAAAKAHFSKLDNYLEEFSPSSILKLSEKEMRSCQISRQKSKYLRALSTAIIEGNLNLDSFPELSENEIRQQLTNVKGIGNWTIDIYLMFCLQAKNISPIGDIVIVNTIKEFSDAETPEEIMTLAEDWQPLRSLATYYHGITI